MHRYFMHIKCQKMISRNNFSLPFKKIEACNTFHGCPVYDLMQTYNIIQISMSKNEHKTRLLMITFYSESYNARHIMQFLLLYKSRKCCSKIINCLGT